MASNLDINLEALTRVSEMRSRTKKWRNSDQSIGFVPTMGALHEGHLSLVRRARAENERVVVSIFVNPLQFGPNEDLARYPRQPEEDLAMLGKAGVDIIYMPAPEEMYKPGAATRVHVSGLEDVLEGFCRPGHFAGVATVVAKLFNICQPDRAYFGQKDAQQVAVLTQMVEDLDFAVELVVMPIVREADGLAMSSRNAYLSAEERQAALCLSRALKAANQLYLEGQHDVSRLEAELRSVLDHEPLAKIDYAEVLDPRDFVSPGNLAVLAVRIGATRLIDNHRLGEEF